VLTASPAGRALGAAILAANAGATMEDRGGYLRIKALPPCRVALERIRTELGEAFDLPSDLEALMPSFRGRLVLDAEGIRWE
jgi:hypothetical protein